MTVPGRATEAIQLPDEHGADTAAACPAAVWDCLDREYENNARKCIPAPLLGPLNR